MLEDGTTRRGWTTVMFFILEILVLSFLQPLFLTSRIFLHILTTISVYFCFTVNRKRIHNRCSDSVKTTGNFIPFPPELSSSMKRRHHSLKSRNFCFLMYVYFYTSAIICYTYTII